MSGKTDIEWTGKTWNPCRAYIREDAVEIATNKGYTSLVQILTGKKSDGVTPRVIPGETWGYHCVVHSPGCSNCYACTMNGRTLPAWGTGLPYDKRSEALIRMHLDQTELFKPLRWNKSEKVFVCSMTDLFGDFVPDKFIHAMFAVMAVTPHLTYQVLTKRADRMTSMILAGEPERNFRRHVQDELDGMGYEIAAKHLPDRWPLPNVQLGFSAEDQKRFDERWAHVKKLAAADWFTWASLEPMISEIDMYEPCPIHGREHIEVYSDGKEICGQCGDEGRGEDAELSSALDWMAWAVVGGESGPRARMFDIGWAKALISQFSAADVPLFIKQFGAAPIETRPVNEPGVTDIRFLHLTDRKGGSPDEWPEWARVRQFPKERAA